MAFELNKIHHSDWMNNGLPDKSVQLLIADPPYFEVKGDFDFIWKTFDEYLQQVEIWAKECKRLLADNGTLFWYGNSKKIAYSQIIIDKYFNLENSLVWRKKDSIQYQYYSPDLARTFNTHNERLLMYSNEVGMTGLEKIMEENIKPLHPFAIYLREEFKRANVTIREIAKLFPSVTGGLTGCVSNWLNGDNVITEEQYNKIREYLNGEYLRKEYEDLRKEYEDQRRFFYNPNKYEEVLEFSQEGHKTGKYDHDTCKPETLTRALILTCSRPKELVFIPFAGSGTEVAMALKEGRTAIGFDTELKYVEMGNTRTDLIKMQPNLFH